MDCKLAQEVAQGLIQEYLGNQWSFKWDRAKTRFGACNYRTKTIQLSIPLTKANDQNEVLDTILHEIAHAIVGPGHGHDVVWQAKAREIGSNGLRCSKQAKGVDYKYAAWCTKCMYLVSLAHKMGRRMQSGNQTHKKDGGKVMWLLNDGVATPSDIMQVQYEDPSNE